MNYPFISKTSLFQGIPAEETKAALDCLSAVKKSFEKNQTVYYRGDRVSDIGLVLSGAVNIVKHDIWGNQAILDHVRGGQMFGETYACLQGEPLAVDVIAAERSEILFLNVNRIMKTCPSSCGFHNKIISNLVYTLAKRNQTLTSKMDHITPRTIRERVLSYLSAQAVKKESCSFEIPFNRQQMADYLSVDRSALSIELSKLQKEGVISFHKNKFDLYL
ncbi:Crp/Fnr family transcriptional regulator [bacterium 210820-DFI.6.37]|nr:Crp/Fnr family transcriptional regulator [bacterium 210820-DFI.6.37]